MLTGEWPRILRLALLEKDVVLAADLPNALDVEGSVLKGVEIRG